MQDQSGHGLCWRVDGPAAPAVEPQGGGSPSSRRACPASLRLAWRRGRRLPGSLSKGLQLVTESPESPAPTPIGVGRAESGADAGQADLLRGRATWSCRPARGRLCMERRPPSPTASCGTTKPAKPGASVTWDNSRAARARPPQHCPCPQQRTPRGLLAWGSPGCGLCRLRRPRALRASRQSLEWGVTVLADPQAPEAQDPRSPGRSGAAGAPLLHLHGRPGQRGEQTLLPSTSHSPTGAGGQPPPALCPGTHHDALQPGVLSRVDNTCGECPQLPLVTRHVREHVPCGNHGAASPFFQVM